MSEKINGFTLHLDFYTGEDQYSDGKIEKDLLDICREHRIREALQQRTEWPLIYHLSSVRENLLEWSEFSSEGSLLEIGSGCGALTGLFCRKLKKVTGIELSKQRSVINAYKNGENGCADIYVGNFEQITMTEKYDYVTLIGVLEYAAAYISAGTNEDPYITLLKKVKDRLKTQGELILAIENKMGLKYWAGAAEDHTGVPYDGISDYAGIGHVRTFTRGELCSLLETCGYKDVVFYYPVPDYKLPLCIYSDGYLPKKGELRFMQTACMGDQYEMFDIHAASDMVCQEQLFPHFANSYLVAAKRGKD